MSFIIKAEKLKGFSYQYLIIIKPKFFNKREKCHAEKFQKSDF